jgi:hypothetical protein
VHHNANLAHCDHPTWRLTVIHQSCVPRKRALKQARRIPANTFGTQSSIVSLVPNLQIVNNDLKLNPHRRSLWDRNPNS